MSVRLPVHVSKKEVRRLRKAGYSLQGTADLLGVSKMHVHRISNGYRCRCGFCPRARKLAELVLLSPRPRPRGPVERVEGPDLLRVLGALLGAAKPTETPDPFIERMKD